MTCRYIYKVYFRAHIRDNDIGSEIREEFNDNINM